MIDQASGVTSFVSQITDPIAGGHGIEAISFADDSTLYAFGASSEQIGLFHLNISDGSLVSIGAISCVDIGTLTYLDGFLFGADSLDDFNADLWRIDPVTAAAINLGKTGVTGLNGLAAIPTAIPLPASYLLLLVGLTGPFLFRLRFRLGTRPSPHPIG